MRTEEHVTKRKGISRRSFIKWASALSATAALYGCSSGDESDTPYIAPQDELVFDKSVKEVMHGHHVHCGGCCMLKLHVKNGRVKRITSAGDISYEKAKFNEQKLFGADPDYGIVPGVWGGSEAADESLSPIQRRCCMKGLSEVQRIYSPDRLKYPLMQTGKRGDINGFVRIEWDEAYDKIAAMYEDMKTYKEQNNLDYLPILDTGGITSYLGNYITWFGSASYGGVADAFYASIGNYSDVNNNTALDMLNSDFIINWANDSRVTRNQLPFYMTAAKEKGIPVIVIDPRYTDTAAIMGTGTSELPSWIAVRPGTDPALQVAMCYVIYKNNKHDKKFIDEYCFGFYPQTVISRSKEKHPVTGVPYKDQPFTVSLEDSFVGYLISLENDPEWGKGTGVGINWTDKDTIGGVDVGDYEYQNILKKAEEITSVKAEVIEKLALAYANAKTAFIHSAYHGGANRSQNGMYYSWLLVALSAMTGNINKRGGGCGEIRFGDGYKVKLGAAPASVTPSAKGQAIQVSRWQLGHVVLTGTDFRDKNDLREDVLQATNKHKTLPAVDIGANGLEIKMLYRGSGDSAPFNQSNDLTKNLLAFSDRDKVKYIVAHELHMSTEALYADIVLPVNHNFERSYFVNRYTDDQLAVNGPVEPMYECRPDWLILQQLANRLGLDMERSGGASDEEIMKAQWENASIPTEYLDLDPTAALPSYEKMIEEANIQLPVPLNKTLVDLEKLAPGEWPTDTGYINFWSPYLKGRNRAVLGKYGPRYVPQEECYEKRGMVGAKGVSYPLVLSTPHMVQRAHAQYDNIAMLKEVLPHVVQINPVNAAERGINDGDTVYIYNDNGCIKLKAEITKRTHPNVIVIGQGAWYRPSKNEEYEAWLDLGNGPEMRKVPVDVGGNVNTLIKGRATGASDPFVPGGHIMSTVGNLCQISKVHPDTI